MKTKLIFITFVSILTCFCLNAQIQVFSAGQTTVGGTTAPPSGYFAHLYGLRSLIGAYPTYSSITIQSSSSDPRIWSSSGVIVFYNSNTSTFNNIQVLNCAQYSDSNGKTNIKPLSNCLNDVRKLQGVSYNWKNNAVNPKLTKTTPDQLQYGLIAQDVEKVVPDLVTTIDSSKGKLLTYSGLIPILIEAIKEQQLQIDSLKQLVNKKGTSSLKSAEISTEVDAATIIEKAALAQNAPNPFSVATTINYYLPETVRQATINIYDLTGIQIKSIPVSLKGNGSITINGYELRPGIFIYNLITDGQEVASKRMVLTQ